MAVKIRLARHGKTKRPFYRLVAAHSEARRSGRYLELLGTVDTLTEPPTLNLKQDRVEHWLAEGATPTPTAAQWINRIAPGHIAGIEEKRVAKIRKARTARKTRAKAAAKKAK